MTLNTLASKRGQLGTLAVGRPSDGWVTPTDIPLAETNALKLLYDLTDGANWTNNTNWGLTETANDWFGVTVSGGDVTEIKLFSNNLIGSVATWQPNVFSGLLQLRLFSNSGIVGDISSWIFPASLLGILLHVTNISGDISGLVLPSGLTAYFLDSTNISGDISGLVLPSGLITLRLNTTSVSGDLSGLGIPANVQNLYIHSTAVNGAPDLTSAVKLNDFRYQDCVLPEADVDANLLVIYNRRASFTNATPTLNIGGSNSAPSATGIAHIVELTTDPGAEGFNKWIITYTAP